MSKPVERTPVALRDALEVALAGAGEAPLARAVAALIERYRAGGAATAPILAGELDVLAYAAYRMPATYAACRRALASGRDAGLESVRTVVDLGGGTGAASWAAADVWPGSRSTLCEQVPEAIRLATRLDSSIDARRWRLGQEIPRGDLVCASYVLSELTGPQQDSLVQTAMAGADEAVLIIDPGTPDGYRRIVAARDRLRSAGWPIAAPCPHQEDCPLGGRDWCHFSVRVERSSLHRRVKRADLGHEDEKFSYVLALNPRGRANAALATADARVLRHPVKRKGLVELQLCRPDGTAGREVVTKRLGPAYKRARDVGWGDRWV